MQPAVIPPVRKTIVVPLPPDRAFDLFFTGMDAWWPLASHSVYGEEAARVTVEAQPGGRLVEHAADGRTSEWGEFLVGDPPMRAVFTWHPGYDDEVATEVEVRFTPEGRLTRVDLEHRGWAALGERAEATREGYETGWNLVFAVRYGGAALRGTDGTARQGRLRRPPDSSLGPFRQPSDSGSSSSPSSRRSRRDAR